MKPSMSSPILFMKKQLRNNFGFSVMEVLIAVGLLGIVSMGLVSLIQNSNKSVAAVEEKLAILDLEKTLVSLSIGRNLCSKSFTTSAAYYTYPVATGVPTSISVSALYLSVSDALPLAQASLGLGNNPNLLIKSINIKNILGSGTNYMGDLTIAFDYKKNTTARKDLSTKVILLGTVASGDITLTSCTVNDPTAGGGPATGIDNQAACNSIGGEWVQPGGGRPDFCTVGSDSLDWY